MDNDDDGTNSDVEYRRYMKILQTNLKLLDREDIEICNAWIQRLSDCKEDEKYLRNKYLFALCLQIAKGVLKHPFCDYPNPNEFPVLFEDVDSDDFLSEIESHFTCSVRHNTGEVTSNARTLSKTVFQSKDSDLTVGTNISKLILGDINDTGAIEKQFHVENLLPSSNANLYYPEILEELSNFVNSDDNVYLRVNNLIEKLRQIKKQNTLLHKKLQAIKKDYKYKKDSESHKILQTYFATSISINGSEGTKKCVNCCCKSSIVKDNNEPDKLKEPKILEIEELKKEHEIEMENLKTSTQKDFQDVYEKKIQALKDDYALNLKEIKKNTESEINNLRTSLMSIATEKDNTLALKNNELTNLRAELEEAKAIIYVLRKNLAIARNDFNPDSVKEKALEFEKRLHKMEKSKNKRVKVYQLQAAKLQRDKNILISSFHLQLLKQRSELIAEFTEKNQREIFTTVEKLEEKYKEMVANVQAIAIQRSLEDQIALETLVQSVYGNACHNNYVTCAHVSHDAFNPKPAKSQHIDGKELLSSIQSCHSAKTITKKNNLKEKLVTGFCLDEVKLEELFERVHIPQRDTGDE